MVAFYQSLVDGLLLVILVIYNISLFKNNKTIEGSNKSKVYNFFNKVIELFVLFFAGGFLCLLVFDF